MPDTLLPIVLQTPSTPATPGRCERTTSIPQMSMNYLGLPLLYHENLFQYFRPNYGP